MVISQAQVRAAAEKFPLGIGVESAAIRAAQMHSADDGNQGRAKKREGYNEDHHDAAVGWRWRFSAASCLFNSARRANCFSRI